MKCSVCGREMVEQDTNHPAFFLLPNVVRVIACPLATVQDKDCHDVRITQAAPQIPHALDIIEWAEEEL